MKNKIVWGARLLAAAILLQTLYFKFSGAPESIYIFKTLGAEPWGRWFAGGSELIASILLLIPATYLFGCLMAIGIMAGAILSHLFVLGLAVQDDGGLLFSLALVVLSCALLILVLRKEELLKKIGGLLGRVE